MPSHMKNSGSGLGSESLLWLHRSAGPVEIFNTTTKWRMMRQWNTYLSGGGAQCSELSVWKLICEKLDEESALNKAVKNWGTHWICVAAIYLPGKHWVVTCLSTTRGEYEMRRVGKRQERIGNIQKCSVHHSCIVFRPKKMVSEE